MTKLSAEQLDQIEARVTDLVIRLALLGLFIYWSLALIRPFMPIVLWAIVLAVALSPLQMWLATHLRGRRTLAAVLITLLALVVIIGPVAILSKSFVDTVQFLMNGVEAGSLQLPPLPKVIADLPVAGEKIAAFWLLAQTNLGQAVVRYQDVLTSAGGRIVGFLSSISFDIISFVLSVILAGALLVSGGKLAAGGKRVASRIAARRGARFVDLAGATIRSVLNGVVGVAFLQAMAIGVVLQVAGIPGAGLLAFLILLLSILQIGASPIVLPVMIWAWLQMSTGSAFLLTLVMLPLTLMDNVLKPLVMGRGLSTPTLVIFLGVMGGTLTYGLIGLFLGPVVLAVVYELLISWISVRSEEPPETT